MEVGFGGGGGGRREGILSLFVLTDSGPKVTWSPSPAAPCSPPLSPGRRDANTCVWPR